MPKTRHCWRDLQVNTCCDGLYMPLLLNRFSPILSRHFYRDITPTGLQKHQKLYTLSTVYNLLYSVIYAKMDEGLTEIFLYLW